MNAVLRPEVIKELNWWASVRNEGMREWDCSFGRPCLSPCFFLPYAIGGVVRYSLVIPVPSRFPFDPSILPSQAG